MLTLLLIFFPLAAALLLFVFKPQNAKVIALTAALLELVISLVVVVEFNKTGGPQWKEYEK